MHLCFCFISETFRVGTNGLIERTTRVRSTARAGTITKLGTATPIATTAQVGTKLSFFVSSHVMTSVIFHGINFDSYLEISNWDIRAEG